MVILIFFNFNFWQLTLMAGLSTTTGYIINRYSAPISVDPKSFDAVVDGESNNTIAEAFADGARAIFVDINTTETVPITIPSGQDLNIVIKAGVTVTVALASVWITLNASHVHISGGSIVMSHNLCDETASSTITLKETQVSLSTVVNVMFNVNRVYVSQVIFSGSVMYFNGTTTREINVINCSFSQVSNIGNALLTYASIIGTVFFSVGLFATANNVHFSNCIIVECIPQTVTDCSFDSCQIEELYMSGVSTNIIISNCIITSAFEFYGASLKVSILNCILPHIIAIAITSCVFCNNNVTGTIDVDQEAASSVITGNRCTGISAGASTSADNVVVGNYAVGTGVVTFTGTVANNQV